MSRTEEHGKFVDKRRFYFWGGLCLFLLGAATIALNLLLAVPDYQKISTFSVYFFLVGGGLGLIIGVPNPSSLSNPLAQKISANLWKIVTLVVAAAFVALLFYVRTAEGDRQVTTLLLFLLFGSYLTFLYLAKLRSGPPEARAKSSETVEVLVVAIALAIFIKGVGVQAFKIPSGSMLNTLQIGDQLLVTKFTYGIPLPYTDARLPGIRKPERGDIIVFSYPGKDNPDRPLWMPPYVHEDPLKGQDFIKRIIGLPGDIIEVRNKKVYIDGEELDDKWGQYLDREGRPKPALLYYQPDDAPGNIPPTRVPDGYYFAMGDNRDNSSDSRAWGFVREGRIRGNAFFIYFSWPKISRIGTIVR